MNSHSAPREPEIRLGDVADLLGIAPTMVRRLTDHGILPSTRTPGGHRRYRASEVRAAWATHRGTTTPGPVPSALAATAAAADDSPFDTPPDVTWEGTPLGLDESDVWRELSPRFGLGPYAAARAVAQYVFTEMLNNAIDHSAGDHITIHGWQTPENLAITVTDNGIGAFQSVAHGKELQAPIEAIAELTKGKQTTAPDKHSGEGIFFSSKAVDTFRLESNGLTWIVDNIRDDQAVGVSHIHQGTRVRFQINLRTAMTLTSLFQQFSEDHDFVRSQPLIKLFGIGVTFVSRSEAKRLLADMDTFEEITLDFAGVESVGQGFVDELFRVWKNDHPDTTLTPVNMNPAVAFMVRRGLPRS